MLGFEHPSHMVTHPSTDEAQCCLSLENLVNSTKKKKKERKKEASRIKSPLRIEGTKNVILYRSNCEPSTTYVPVRISSNCLTPLSNY